MTFISYAQNYEDVMLWRALKDIENGFYVDVGANDPTIDSVTKAFYDQGWRGINIEPVQQYYQRLSDERPSDINLPVGVADKEEELTFYEIAETGLSTLDKETAEQHRQDGWEITERKISVLTLDQIFEEHVNGPIHFLKIDVEGAEGKVLQGLDLSDWRPWIVVIEATKPGSTEVDFLTWKPLLTAQEYEMVYFDGLNRFYVANEISPLKKSFKTPPNVFDNFVTRKHWKIRDTLSQLDKVRSDKEEVQKQLAQVRIDRGAIREKLDQIWAEREKTRKQLEKAWTKQEKTQTQLENAREDRGQIQLRLHETREEQHKTQLQLDKAKKDKEESEKRLHLILAEKEKTQTRLDEVISEQEQLQTQLDQILIEKEKTKTWLDEVISERDQLQTQLDLVWTERNEYWSQLDQTWRERHEYWSQLDTIYNSRSWKLLAPARKLSESIRFWKARINRIIHNPPSYSVAKILYRIRMLLMRTSLGERLLAKVKFSYPDFWHRGASWSKRSAKIAPITVSSPQIYSTADVEGNNEISDHEKRFVALFRRELRKRQEDRKGKK